MTEQIPAEAVEAAARVLWDADEDPEPREHYSWAYLTDHARLWPDNYGPIRNGYLTKAEVAIAAALPHLAQTGRAVPSVEDREALALGLWDEGIIRPESLARAAVDYILDDPLTSAAPTVEQVREQVAREIEAWRGPAPDGDASDSVMVGHWVDSRDGEFAARIARGQS